MNVQRMSAVSKIWCVTVVTAAWGVLACASAPAPKPTAAAETNADVESSAETETAPVESAPAPTTERVAWIQIRGDGGLTPWGDGWSKTVIHSDGFITYDDVKPDPPTTGLLTPEQLDAMTTSYSSLDVGQLEKGYGACCQAHSDGTDLYVSFPMSEQPDREIRISHIEKTPQALRQLVTEALAATGAGAPSTM
jgi:hypothetical protein